MYLKTKAQEGRGASTVTASGWGTVDGKNKPTALTKTPSNN